jgi:outer membrane protein
MKNTLKLAVALAVVAVCGNVSAQTNLKIAYINMQELITTMPEYDSASVKLKKFSTELEREMELLQVEQNKKLEDYTNNSKNWTDLVRKSREDEIQAIRARIATFQEQAQESYAQKQEEFLQPVLEKANKAIEAVAKEQGITYVLNAQILHYKAIGSLDLLSAVKQYLGIKK